MLPGDRLEQRPVQKSKTQKSKTQKRQNTTQAKYKKTHAVLPGDRLEQSLAQKNNQSICLVLSKAEMLKYIAFPFPQQTKIRRYWLWEPWYGFMSFEIFDFFCFHPFLNRLQCNDCLISAEQCPVLMVTVNVHLALSPWWVDLYHFWKIGWPTSTWTIAKVVNNELIFFRKFSDPDTRKDKEDEPRLHYYKIKILQVRIEKGIVWVLKLSIERINYSVFVSLLYSALLQDKDTSGEDGESLCVPILPHRVYSAVWKGLRRIFLYFAAKQLCVFSACLFVCMYFSERLFVFVSLCLIVRVSVYISVFVSLSGVNEDWSITHPNTSKMFAQNAFQTTRFFCNWRVAKANWL